METSVKITKEEFNRSLSGFHGTENYYEHRLHNGLSMNLTDGCDFVRANAANGAYWLFDLILSWQNKLKGETFQVWKLEKQPDETWTIECRDGNNNFLAAQEIPYSDFPLDKFEVWLIDQVCLLPSEY